MKETAGITLFFLFLGIYSGAMNIAAILIFIIISCLLTYIAWLEDKKDKLKKQQLVLKRKKRMARQNMT